MEGDRCTPEGNFHIIAKKHNKWDCFMPLIALQRELRKIQERRYGAKYLQMQELVAALVFMAPGLMMIIL